MFHPVLSVGAVDPATRVLELEAQLIEADARRAVAEVQLEDKRAELEISETKRAKLRTAYDALLFELQLMKRRIFIAKAERVDTSALQMEFEDLLKQLDELAKTGDMPPPGGDGADDDGADDDGAGDDSDGDDGAGDDSDGDDSDGAGDDTGRRRRRSKPKGRRNLADADMPEERVEITAPELEALVEQGKAKRMGFEISYKIGWIVGGPRRITIARVKYQTIDDDGESAVATAPTEPTLLKRSLAAPSFLARLMVAKFCDGLPFNRVTDILQRSALKLDRGTMSRWAEELGGIFGATVVEAMRQDAFARAFSIAADATGVRVQPERVPKNKGQRPRRQACERGHYMVMIADKDHIWFEYTERETSDAVAAMFEGYSGYVQVDAKSVFDVLFRPQSATSAATRVEVGCWAHARRKFWEATLAQHKVAREALARISRMFQLEASWKGLPHEEITRRRQAHQAVHVEAFMSWVAVEYERVKHMRGPLRSALGYAVRQKDALMAFLADGRLRMDNNPSELALRGRVAVGRKAWLFAGSHMHAESAAGLMSLIASARLHTLNPETYLRELIRVLPYWPRDRYLELTPLHWSCTRARLDTTELASDAGRITVPKPPATSEEQPSSN